MPEQPRDLLWDDRRDRAAAGVLSNGIEGNDLMQGCKSV
jgi:hypothetical protein